MTHPTPADLVELHFGEAGPLRQSRLSAHARDCEACRGVLADLAWAEEQLASWPDPEPPKDGLERVLARVAAAGAATPGAAPAWRRLPWPAVAPCAAALGALAAAVLIGGVTAGLAFLGAGTLVTLSLAPALILETQRREGAPAAR